MQGLLSGNQFQLISLRLSMRCCASNNHNDFTLKSNLHSASQPPQATNDFLSVAFY